MHHNYISHSATNAMSTGTGQLTANKKKNVENAVQKIIKQTHVRAQYTLAVDARELIKLGLLSVPTGLLRVKDWRR